MKFFTNDMIKKGENGAITLFVLMACLFFVFILSGVYISNLNKMQMQEQQLEQIKDNYARTITNFEEQAGPKPKEIYSESGLEEEAENNIDLFEYEIISNEEIEDTTFAQSLPKKTARITRIKDMYCNSVYGGIYNPEVGAKVNTYYQIKNYKGKDISDTLVIPYQAKINGEMYRITEVNLWVYGCNTPSVLWNREGYALPNVNTIIYPNTIKKIFTTSNNVCSGSNTIQNVILSESLSEIGTNAFRGISKLKNITLPNSVTSIGSRAFYSSGLTSITIPNSVTSIGSYAFARCTELASVVIPNSVTSIGEFAFADCHDLTSITIPDSVVNIGDGAFSGCSKLTSVAIPDNVTRIENDVFYGCYKLTSITIPNSVTSIGSYAFALCTELTSITIPDSVTSIEDKVFRSCSKLTNITIPNSVTSIGDYVFDGCTNLKTVNFRGTQEEWNKITIGTGNKSLTDATINYNYKGN